MNFDIERLNSKMNCNCLQSIIENDRGKHNVDETQLGRKIVQKTLGVEIFFGTIMAYTNLQWCHVDGMITVREKDCCGIPLFFCSICGKKTKYDSPHKESFYYKIQKKAKGEACEKKS